MKTNLVKKGSEKNIEMFKMTNDELATVNGGKYVAVLDEDGNIVFILINKSKSSYDSFHSRD
jgi:bacteriocin-like protein